MKRKFVIKRSRINGKGAFAAVAIKKGETICRMAGEEISIAELQRRFESGEERSTDPLQVGASRYLDLDKPFVFINHSCDPNATIVDFNTLVAIRDIRIGEEITYDYSLTEWSDDRSWPGYDDWEMACACGSAACRKKIVEFRFLPKRLQKVFVQKKRVQDHILMKYKKRHRTG